MNIDQIKPWFTWWLNDDGNVQIELSRLVGGLILPMGRNPGFAVIVAQEKHMPPGFQAYRLFTVHEIEEYDTDTFLRRCLDMAHRQKIMQWYGNTESPSVIAVMRTFNMQCQSQNMPTIGLLPAPLLSGDNPTQCYAYGLRRIQDRTAPGRVTLTFTGKSKIPAAFLAVPPESATGDKIEHHPPVAALCYAITALDFYSTPNVTVKEQTHTVDDSPKPWKVNLKKK